MSDTMKKKENRNAFTDLLDALCEGKLGHNQIQIAYRAWMRQRKDCPDGIKDLLSGKSESDPGLVFRLFALIPLAAGAIELAYRRGYEMGLYDAKKLKAKKRSKL